MSKFITSLKEYKYTIIIIVTIIQIVIMFYYFKMKNEVHNIEEENYIVPVNVTFDEVSEIFELDKGIELLEVEDLGDKWYVKIMINGNNEKVEKIINKLGEYEIYDYNISGKDGILSVILELYR